MTIGKSALVTALWHQDSHGKKNPEDLVGKTFVHVATAKLYTVTGFSLNVTGDKVTWTLHYDREDREKRLGFSFTRAMHEFLDGRFLGVE
jgi:hypothetical protein